MELKMEDKEFEINNSFYRIIHLCNSDMLFYYKKNSNDEDIDVVFGITDYKNHNIYINSDICDDQKIKTLKHELMHVYIFEYYSVKDEYSEEELCDISANSHDIIHEIVERYFKDDSKSSK